MIQLRAVMESDLAVFFEQQQEPEACRIAAFPPRGLEAFFLHWKNNILADDSVPAFAIDIDGEIAGYVLSWKGGDRRLVRFWLGRAYWSRGIATRAVSDFLRVVTERPLSAHVARENMASIRVLEKCGFVIDPIATDEYAESDDGVPKLVLF